MTPPQTLPMGCRAIFQIAPARSTTQHRISLKENQSRVISGQKLRKRSAAMTRAPERHTPAIDQQLPDRKPMGTLWNGSRMEFKRV
jgi:hypothetical protein